MQAHYSAGLQAHTWLSGPLPSWPCSLRCCVARTFPFLLFFFFSSLARHAHLTPRAAVLVFIRSSSARVLIVGPAGDEAMFFSTWYLGPPVLVLPDSVGFDNGSASLISVTITVSPALNPSIEGLSLSNMSLLSVAVRDCSDVPVGTSVLVERPNATSYVLRSSNATQLTQVLRTVSYYNFQDDMGSATRTVLFTTLDSASVTSVSMAVVRLKPALDIPCATSPTDVDVVFVFDGSSSSSSASFQEASTSFVRSVLSTIPVSSNTVRFV